MWDGGWYTLWFGLQFEFVHDDYCILLGGWHRPMAVFLMYRLLYPNTWRSCTKEGLAEWNHQILTTLLNPICKCPFLQHKNQLLQNWWTIIEPKLYIVVVFSLMIISPKKIKGDYSRKTIICVGLGYPSWFDSKVLVIAILYKHWPDTHEFITLLNCEKDGLDCHVITAEYRTCIL